MTYDEAKLLVLDLLPEEGDRFFCTDVDGCSYFQEVGVVTHVGTSWVTRQIKLPSRIKSKKFEFVTAFIPPSDAVLRIKFPSCSVRYTLDGWFLALSEKRLERV